jgi:hypothetical protein
MSRKVLVLLFVAVVAQVLGEFVPSISLTKVKCFDRECPGNTFICKRFVSTSRNREFLLTNITCLDEQGMVLENYKQNTTNPYALYIKFQSVSYSGSYVPHGGTVDVNKNQQNKYTLTET